MSETSPTLSPTSKLALATRVWCTFIAMEIAVRIEPLPRLAARLGRRPGSAGDGLGPERLSRIVSRTLQLGSYRPRCLITALVLFRLLRQQGVAAQLVIGLPVEPKDERAHAWVELAGIDLGPSPGRGDHRELVRYG